MPQLNLLLERTFFPRPISEARISWTDETSWSYEQYSAGKEKEKKSTLIKMPMKPCTISIATDLAHGAHPLVVFIIRRLVEIAAVQVEHSRALVAAEYVSAIVTHPAVGVILGALLRQLNNLNHRNYGWINEEHRERNTSRRKRTFTRASINANNNL